MRNWGSLNLLVGLAALLGVLKTIYLFARPFIRPGRLPDQAPADFEEAPSYSGSTCEPIKDRGRGLERGRRLGFRLPAMSFQVGGQSRLSESTILLGS
jgi:hypothetical protein